MKRLFYFLELWDYIAFAGVMLVIGGIAQLSLPSALIVSGMFLVALGCGGAAWLMHRK